MCLLFKNCTTRIKPKDYRHYRLFASVYLLKRDDREVIPFFYFVINPIFFILSLHLKLGKDIVVRILHIAVFNVAGVPMTSVQAERSLEYPFC